MADHGVRAHLGAHARLHGWHAQLIGGVMPVTAHLDPERLTAPAAGVAAFFDLLACPPGPDPTLERLVGLYRVVLPRLVGTYERHRRVASPLAEGPVLRALGFVLADHAEDLRGAEGLLGRLSAGAGAGRRAGAWQDRLEAELTSVGGLAGDGSEG